MHLVIAEPSGRRCASVFNCATQQTPRRSNCHSNGFNVFLTCAFNCKSLESLLTFARTHQTPCGRSKRWAHPKRNPPFASTICCSSPNTNTTTTTHRSNDTCSPQHHHQRTRQPPPTTTNTTRTRTRTQQAWSTSH